MKNSRGFSSIEIFGIIIILLVSFLLISSFIFGSSFPSIISTINSKIGSKLGIFMKPVEINQNQGVVVAEAGPDKYACIGETIILDASKSSSQQGNPIIKYLWNVDYKPDSDENLTEGKIIEVNYSDTFISTDYKVKLYVISKDGQMDEDELTVHVIDKCINTFNSMNWEVSNNSLESFTISSNFNIIKAELAIQPLKNNIGEYPSYLKIDFQNDDNYDWLIRNLTKPITINFKDELQQEIDRNKDKQIVKIKFKFITDGKFKIIKLAVPYKIDLM